ncbi:MAG: CopG family transcriptional regulator [Alphaproteobacteria bacterium]|nr:CopG family transcriptional regulator [Alphaproteobacteria bacterium]
MRTTLDISEDILQAAKELAARKNMSMGEVISDLARTTLRGDAKPSKTGMRNGFPILAPVGKAIPSELIKSMVDSDD